MRDRGGDKSTAKSAALLGMGNKTCEVQQMTAGQENELEVILSGMEAEMDVKNRRKVGENKMNGG